MLRTQAFFLATWSLAAAIAPASAAETTPSLDTIRANMRRAVGTAPTDETVTTSFTRYGTTGTQVRIRSGKDFRFDSTTGPLHIASGFVGGVSWRQNANGLTVVNASDPGEPVREATVTTIDHIFEPTELYVISSLTPLGRGLKEYVDPATWHEVRVDTISANETTTTTYDDFRTVAGFTRPWHLTITDGHPENDATFTITADDVRPVAASALAVPKDLRTLVEFPTGTPSVQIPARFDFQSGKFFVRVTIGDRGLDLLLDSGASGIVIDRDVAQSLGLPEYATFSNGANAGRYVGTRTIVPSMAIGDLTMHDVAISTTPNLGIRTLDTKIVGLVGFDFLRGVSAKLDYASGTVTAYDPKAFVPPSGEHTIDLDVRLGRSVPETSVTINGAVGTRFTVDTGGVGALMINDYFRRLHPGAASDAEHAPQTHIFRGVGGAFQADAVVLKEFKLGQAEFVNSGAYVVRSNTSYGSDEDGTIGPDLLRGFTVYLDLPHDKIYLVPPA